MTAFWNLIGRNFTHTSGGHTGRCGTHGKLPQQVQWSFDYDSEISFYIDQTMFSHLNEPGDQRRFGWLLESESIKPAIYKRVAEQREQLFQRYEAIFTHNQALLALDPRFRFTVCCGYWVKDTGLHPKSRLVSAISSGKDMCDGHRWRNRFIERHRGRFDLFGNSYQHIDAKEMGLNDYMFSVAIENGSYATYFTEKLLDCFATGTIPLYRGAPDVGDYVNSDGIIFVEESFDFDQLTPELYYNKLDAVRDNFERLSRYHCAEDFIYEQYRGEYGWA